MLTPNPNLQKLLVTVTPSTNVNLEWIVEERTSSPDNSWFAQASYAWSGYESYTELLAVKSDGSISWRINKLWRLDAEVSVIPKILLWSKDGQSLYYTNWAFTGGCTSFVNAGDLHRLNLHSGQDTELAPLLGYPLGTWLSISPDEKTLAYLENIRSNKLIIKELGTGTEKSILLDNKWLGENYRIGHIIWAPDNNTIALSVAANTCDPTGKPWTYTSVAIVDIKLASVHFIFDNDPRLLITEKWADNNVLFLINPHGELWKYTLEDQQLKQATQETKER